jgi:hypothetical protein
LATLTKGKTFGATESVTAAKLHALVDSASISGIINADCSASMALAESKIAFSGVTAVLTSTNQTVAGVKTFSSFSVTPSAAPTADYQVSNKKYVDDAIDTDIAALKLDDCAAPDDNTDLDFSTSTHGLCPKGTNVGDYLKDDGTWGTITANTSNILWTYGLTGAYSAGHTGITLNAGTAPAADFTAYSVSWTNDTSSYVTMIRSKFKKIAGVSTITWYAYVNTMSIAQAAYVNVDVGGQSSASVSTGTHTTQQWITNTIDVSGLTNGTVYEVQIQLKTANPGDGAAMYYTCGIGS